MFNGSDWECRGGHLYVAGYSLADAVRLVNEAYRRLNGHTDRPDINPISEHFARVYWNKGCWGVKMDGIVPERGVWWMEQDFGPKSGEAPRRLV